MPKPNISIMQDSSGRVHKESIFTVQAIANFAKSIMFKSEAIVAIKKPDYVWASISGYYSLFHLSISIAYLKPIYIKQNLLTKLIDERQDGASDPTKQISHRILPSILENCERDSLTPTVRKSLDTARQMREFVNYGPKIEWNGNIVRFRSKEFTTEEIKQVVYGINQLHRTSLEWAATVGEESRVTAQFIKLQIMEFFHRDDLLYKEWCSEEVTAEALLTCRQLMQG